MSEPSGIGIISTTSRDGIRSGVKIGPDTDKGDRETETRFHTEQLRKLADAWPHAIRSVELLLMSLDGTVEPVTLAA